MDRNDSSDSEEIVAFTFTMTDLM